MSTTISVLGVLEIEDRDMADKNTLRNNGQAFPKFGGRHELKNSTISASPKEIQRKPHSGK